MDSNKIQQLNIEEYVNQKKIIYNSLFEFLNNSEVDENDFQAFTKSLNINEKEVDREELFHVLELINSVSNNSHRRQNFSSKFSKIFEYLKDQIKQTFSNIEIFNIFKANKLILYLLVKNGVITLSEQIYQLIFCQTEANGYKMCHFFYPEVKQFMNDEQNKYFEKELLDIDENIFNNFDEKREKGENCSYLCELIRQDKVEEFVSYVNRANINLKSNIDESIFETNAFLIENPPTLIEYSAFFGSIQIFQYLRMNNVKLKPSLWLYAIHSRSAELIRLLESCKVHPMCNNYEESYIESIKCHHNEIADYIESTLLKKEISKELIISTILNSHNYEYFSTDIDESYVFFYLCSNSYYKLVDFFLKKKESYIKSKINEITYKSFFFYNIYL